MVGSDLDPVKTGASGEFMVEVIGPDGLKHHIGPFKSRAEAQAWIDENPSQSIPQAPPRRENSAPRRGATNVE